MVFTSLIPSVPIKRHTALLALLIGSLALLSIWGTPFLYDRGNSGRYLLAVIQAADTELFPQDSVVESLQRFDSVFYNLLAMAVRTTDIAPVQIERLMWALYVVYNFCLYLVLFSFARRFSNDLWFFILLGAWAAHQKRAIGGNALFEPQLIHISVAFLLGLLALNALLKERLFGFWAFSSLAVLMHALVGFQLVLVIAPLYWWKKRQIDRATILGLGVFLIAAGIYLLFMTPPAMSSSEAAIFLESKGNIYHISPFNQPLFEWARTVGVLALSLAAYFVYLRDNGSANLLAGAIIFGACAAVLLGTIAVVFPSVRLAQFQPMRIYLWIDFFAHILIILATARALMRRSPAGLLLLGYLVLTIAVSLWALPFVALTLSYFAVRRFAVWCWPELLPRIEVAARWTITIVFAAVVGGWLIGRLFDLPMETLLNSTPPIVVGILTLLALSPPADFRRQSVLLGLMIIFALAGVSVYRHAFYAVREDPNWRAAQLWSRENTQKTDKFIVTPGAGENFRTRSFRTALGEPMSALCWVDPIECRRNSEQVERVEEAKQEGVWRLSVLANLAHSWNAQYILIAGTYDDNFEPVFRSGKYSVFRVSELLESMERED